MARGGKRPGSGRPPGARNKRSIEQEAQIRESGKTPLEYLVSIYQDEEQPERMRLEAARSAAPYVHPKLSAVDMDLGRDNRTVEEMSDEELNNLIQSLTEQGVDND